MPEMIYHVRRLYSAVGALNGKVTISLMCIAVFLVVNMPSEVCRGEPDAGWGIPVPIENISWPAGSSPSIAVESSGDAFAVWRQWDEYRYNILANRYVVGHGWFSPEIIDIQSADAGSSVISSDDAGNAMAAWIQASDEVWACRYRAGVGWETAVLVTTAADSVMSLDVAIDSNGNGIVVWALVMGEDAWASVWNVSDGWGTPVVLDSEDYRVLLPKAAMDDTGNATVVWSDMEITNHIWANTYSSESGWASAQLVENDETHYADKPDVSMDGLGNAMAVWHQYGTPESDIWANRYVAGVGWGTPELLEEFDAGNARNVVVGYDGHGNALAVWTQFDGFRENVSANRYVAGVGWGDAVLIETDDTGHAQYPRVAVNADGYAFAAWNQNDGDRFNLWANRFVPDVGWEDAVAVEAAPGECGFASIGIDGAGNAIVAWSQDDYGSYSIYANRYVVADTTPPFLIVTSPESGAETTVPSITVAGETEPGAELFVNGMLTLVDAMTGAFETTVALTEGDNDIILIASDSWGNSATVTVTVTYVNLVADLQEQLEELKTLLEELTGDSNTSETNLSALNEEIAALRDQLNLTVDELEEISDRLDAIDDSDVVGSGASDAPSMATLMGVVAVAALLLLAVMIALYLNLRKMVHEGKASREDSEEPPPPQ